jgi:hypothetical protein
MAALVAGQHRVRRYDPPLPGGRRNNLLDRSLQEHADDLGAATSGGPGLHVWLWIDRFKGPHIGMVKRAPGQSVALERRARRIRVGPGRR